MKKNIIEEAIANISSTSNALKKYCNDPQNYNSAGFNFLDRVVWELSLQLNDLQEIKESYGI
jgi:hypothetical protein